MFNPKTCLLRLTRKLSYKLFHNVPSRAWWNKKGIKSNVIYQGLCWTSLNKERSEFGLVEKFFKGFSLSCLWILFCRWEKLRLCSSLSIWITTIFKKKIWNCFRPCISPAMPLNIGMSFMQTLEQKEVKWTMFASSLNMHVCIAIYICNTLASCRIEVTFP